MDRAINNKAGPDGNHDPGDPSNQPVAKRLAGKAPQPGAGHRLCRSSHEPLTPSKVRQGHVYGHWAIGFALKRQPPPSAALSEAAGTIIVAPVANKVCNTDSVALCYC